DGVWSEWSKWGDCSVSCELGQRSRSRTCIFPDPLTTDLPCIGDDVETMACNLGTCPVSVDGVWGDWGQWSDCGVTCGQGERLRTRECIFPDPANMGADCSGAPNETEICNIQACPVDGVWSEWSKWGDCSVSCELGQRSRSRTCIFPDPLTTDLPCIGDDVETMACNLGTCPVSVDGVWGDWGQWSDCGVTCGQGERLRTRECIFPDPANMGADCSGAPNETEICNIQACPVDGVWGDWEQWSDCGATCGEGQRSRSRECIFPDPANKGANCSGVSTETETCNIQACPETPVDGVWGEWGEWSACGATCGDSQRSRTRVCIFQDPANPGADCIGLSMSNETCNMQDCPVDGVWGDWEQWSDCGATCGESQRSKSRECIFPDPANKGANCSGVSTETETCNIQACPEGDPYWGEWVVSQCSENCGKGIRTSTRFCLISGVETDVNKCKGKAEKTTGCKGINCEVYTDCTWLEWSAWSQCSATCGEGTRSREREHWYPTNTMDGECYGRDIESMSCQVTHC
ncbi:A disintegrin and metalloproteinase with thrombospondin motifs adt-1-like, partial [Ruditapes philippinarum]|uniref:A disintegrin and metalloproteinase with thrombospondin motifs adt-1-like n=1 Tax=Ruditapes philippinarum TaxID=129788 RepID=UPI00295C175D